MSNRQSARVNVWIYGVLAHAIEFGHGREGFADKSRREVGAVERRLEGKQINRTLRAPGQRLLAQETSPATAITPVAIKKPRRGSETGWSVLRNANTAKQMAGTKNSCC